MIEKKKETLMNKKDQQMKYTGKIKILISLQLDILMIKKKKNFQNKEKRNFKIMVKIMQIDILLL